LRFSGNLDQYLARISAELAAILSEDFRILPHCLEIKGFPPTPRLDFPSG